MIKVFVYGSLMSGMYNHSVLGLNPVLISGQAVTKEPDYMMKHGAFPSVISAVGKGYICGEVYEVSETILADLDALEGHPNFYRRIEIEVVPDGGEPFDCWIYIGPDTHGPVITSGDWRKHLGGN